MNEQLKAVQIEIEAAHLELSEADRIYDGMRRAAMQRLNLANVRLATLISMLPKTRKGEA